MASQEYKDKYFEAWNTCKKLEVQLQEAYQKLADSAKTGVPAKLTDTELYIFKSLNEARERFLEIARNPD